MTREEAIEVLKKNRPSADPRRCGQELCTALDMAIAVLREQETVTDRHQSETVTNRNGLSGCEFCDNGEQYSTYDKYGTNLTLAFCPVCGRRLEEV